MALLNNRHPTPPLSVSSFSLSHTHIPSACLLVFSYWSNAGIKPIRLINCVTFLVSSSAIPLSDVHFLLPRTLQKPLHSLMSAGDTMDPRIFPRTFTLASWHYLNFLKYQKCLPSPTMNHTAFLFFLSVWCHLHSEQYTSINVWWSHINFWWLVVTDVSLDSHTVFTFCFISIMLKAPVNHVPLVPQTLHDK